MCELFCASSKKEVKINSYLDNFYSHCVDHPHGWGLAIVNDNKINIQKEAVKASESKKLRDILSKPVLVKESLAHIRLATIGSTNPKNCHPFSKEDNFGNIWILIHNGTIFKYDELDEYIDVQDGQTDSERILLYIVQQVDTLQKQLNRSLSSEECFNLLDNLVIDLSKGNKLNIMIYTREHIFVHTNYKNSLYYLQKNNSIIVSTKSLTEDEWKKIPINQLTGLAQGEIVFKGSIHENEYIITKENVKFIFDNLSPEQKKNFITQYGEFHSFVKYLEIQ